MELIRTTIVRVKMKNKIHLDKAIITLGLGCFIFGATHAFGQGEPSYLPKATTDPNYRLSVRDRLSISVFDEPNLAMAQGIDAKGEIKLPLIGLFRIEGMTIRDVEKMLEEEYVKQEILRSPIVSLDVLTYSPKEVSVLGTIARAGQIPFPPEIEKIDIVELISMVGGFTPLSKSKDVRVTRTLPNGSQVILHVNVEEMIEGRKKNRDVPVTYIYPGDLIFVDEVFL